MNLPPQKFPLLAENKMLKQNLRPKIYLLFSILFIILGGVFFWFSFEDEKAMAQPAATNYSETWQPIGANSDSGCGDIFGYIGSSVQATAGAGCSYPAGWLVAGNIGASSYQEIWQAQGVAVCNATPFSQDYYRAGEWGTGCGFPAGWVVKGSIGGSPYSTTAIKTSGQGVTAESTKHWLIRQYGLIKRVGIGRCDDNTSVSQWDVGWYYNVNIATGQNTPQKQGLDYRVDQFGAYTYPIAEAPLCYSYSVFPCQFWNCYSNAANDYVLAAQFCAVWPPIIWDNRAAYQPAVQGPSPLCTKVEIYQPTP